MMPEKMNPEKTVPLPLSLKAKLCSFTTRAKENATLCENIILFLRCLINGLSKQKQQALSKRRIIALLSSKNFLSFARGISSLRWRTTF